MLAALLTAPAKHTNPRNIRGSVLETDGELFWMGSLGEGIRGEDFLHSLGLLVCKSDAGLLAEAVAQVIPPELPSQERIRWIPVSPQLAGGRLSCCVR
jgi:hypothetical protein